MATKKTARKYSPEASQTVEREMKEMKEGKLTSGSGQKVTNPKQAIAIGLSEARKAGKKVPPPPAEKRRQEDRRQESSGKEVIGKEDGG